VLMIWWPFAPKLERADTLEVTDLHSDAPPLYSTWISLLGDFAETKHPSAVSQGVFKSKAFS